MDHDQDDSKTQFFFGLHWSDEPFKLAADLLVFTVTAEFSRHGDNNNASR